MSTVPYVNKINMEPVLHMASCYQILTFIGGTVALFFVTYDSTLLTKGEGPHLLATGR